MYDIILINDSYCYRQYSPSSVFTIQFVIHNYMWCVFYIKCFYFLFSRRKSKDRVYSPSILVRILTINGSYVYCICIHAHAYIYIYIYIKNIAQEDQRLKRCYIFHIALRGVNCTILSVYRTGYAYGKEPEGFQKVFLSPFRAG